MKRLLTLLCLMCFLIGFAGCGSREGGLVTDQSEMTIQEYEAMVAAQPTEDPPVNGDSTVE